LPDHPGGQRYCGVAFAIGNKGYIGMGSDTTFDVHDLSDFWEYAPVSTGLQEHSLQMNSVTVFPSPAHEIIMLEFLDGSQYGDQIKVECFDGDGKKVFSKNTVLKDKKVMLDVRDLTAGLYFVNCTKKCQLIGTAKFVVQ
jgi:hypothetical protein